MQNLKHYGLQLLYKHGDTCQPEQKSFVNGVYDYFFKSKE
jgi:hypothetical protein